MSTSDRVGGLIQEPIVGVAKGIAAPGKAGAIASGTVGGSLGAVSGFIYGTIASVVSGIAPGMAILGGVLGTGIGAAAHAAIGGTLLHAAIVGAEIGAVALGGGTVLAAAAAGALGIGIVGAAITSLAPSAVGGAVGLVTGTFKGIKNFFSGRPAIEQNEQQLGALREQAMVEQAKTEAFLRQRERAMAMQDVSNPEARDDNVAKLQKAKQQQQAQTTSVQAI